jgi:hypothetical protein
MNKLITKRYGFVLLDLNNPTQLTTMKKDERSSRKWCPKFASSMASLHKNGLIFQNIQNFVVLNLIGLSKTFELYIL